MAFRAPPLEGGVRGRAGEGVLQTSPGRIKPGPSIRAGKLASSATRGVPGYTEGIRLVHAPMLSNPARQLHLVAYDIADPRRLARVHRYMLGWKVGGQKSFYECWLTPAELNAVVDALRGLIVPEVDRVHLFQLDARMQPKCYGLARSAKEQAFIIV